MSRTIILTFGSLATFSALALAQSPIEPPRRATPPTDASLLAPPAKGVVLPGAAPAADSPPEASQTPADPLPALPAATEAAAAKPPVATGANPAAVEAAKARAAEFKARAAAAAARAGAPGGAPAGGPGGLPGGPNPGAGGGVNPAGGPGPKAGVPLSSPAGADPFAQPGGQPAGAATGAGQFVEITQNLTASVDDVIADYELNTGVTVLRTGNIQGTVPISVNPAVRMTKEEYVDYMKAVLMVNGFSIHEYSPKLHAITFTGQATPLFSAAPNFKGNQVFTREADLPERDEFVNYFMKFDNLTAQDAATLIGQPQHQSGKVTPVPSAGGLLITESVPVIRSFIAIKKEVDIPGSIMENKFVQLKIADAEEVAGVIQQILQQQSAANSKGGAGAGGGSRLVAAPNAAQQLNAQLAGQPNPAGGTPAGTQAAPDSSAIVVQADRRTNRILLSGKKSDVAYIEKLIHEFDLPSEIENFVTYPLRFIRVTDFIELATGALEARGFGASGGGAGGGGSSAGGAAGGATGGNRQASGNGYPTGGASGTNTRSSQAATNSRSSGGSSSRSSGGAAGGAGGVNGGGGGSSRGGAGASAQNTMAIPSSTTVGKTLLISDPQSNAIIVSGTPEARDQIRILIQQMDKRPLQVHIDCIIAELSLGDNLEYGLDLLRKVDNLSIGGKSVDAGGIFRNTPSGADSSSTGIIDPSVLTALAGFPAGASGLNTYFSVGELVNGYIRASEGTSKVKVIQKPSFSTSNNEPAYISIGQQVPYPGQQQSYLNGTGGTTGGSVNSTVEYKDVVLSLDVTPLINSKEEVTLQIQQINDNVTGSSVINNNKIPIISQQELNTKLTVPNHGIAVIGGLIADRRDGSNNGAPILARIPIIRNLLGNTTKADSRRELMIFMQPSIMAGPDDMIEVNSREVARTIVGPDAEKFARPEMNMKDVVMPTAQGNIPYDSAGYPKDQQPGFWRRLGGIFKRKTNVPADPAYPR